MLFEQIIGNEENKKILIKSVNNRAFLHSYLFYGADGIGKKIFAKEFAKMILCNSENGNYPCDMCKSCVEFNSNNNPDFFIIEPDGNSIKVDQIRQIQKSMMEKPIVSNKKVYIINDCHTMTKEAQNCMLKTLEEPQEYIVIILIASNENNILPTVKSRCTKMYFKELNEEEIIRYIKQKYNQSNIDKNMIKLCGGSIAKADFVVRKAEVLNRVKDFIIQIKNYNKLNFIQNNQILYDNKEDIYEILDYIYILLFDKIREDIRYINAMKLIDNAKIKLANSNNYEMTIDNMLIKMWEDVNEKNSRN